MKSFIMELCFCIMLCACIIMGGCHNESDYAPGNSQYGNDPKTDTTVNGAAKPADMEYGKEKEHYEGNNPKANNQMTIDSNREKQGAIPDSNTNPMNDKNALQKSNNALSGTGESGHAPANNVAPANDPNNKAKRDTTKYKK